MSMRVGIGYDIHCLEKKLKLTLGGIIIPYKMGLKGHSDADVLLHSVCDALLGAAKLGDIGEHFPDSDDSYKNISSTKLLGKTYKMVRNKGFLLVNLDATIFAQEPNFSKYKPRMEESISNIMDVSISLVNVKATTTEYLGVIGRREGIAAMCVVCLV